MDKCLASSEEKIKKICDALKRETLEPAEKEAESILESAKNRAKQLIDEANQEKENIIALAKQKIEKERQVFLTTLQQAGKQSIEKLKQDIEYKLFDEVMEKSIIKEAKNSKTIAVIITVIVEAIEKEGLTANLEAIIPKSVSAKEVCGFLGEKILQKLKEKSITVGEFKGGAMIKMVDKQMTLDFSDQAIFELISGYVRKDFRKLIFKS